MSEKITYGVRNGHFASVSFDSEGVPVFGATEAWDGWSAMSLPPVGDPLEVYASDVLYFKMHVNQGYSGNLSVYQIPENFKIEHMGEYKDTNGVLIEKSSSKPKDFALLGEFQTADDDSVDPKRFALYNCVAGRADLSGDTKTKTLTPANMNIPITVAPTIKDEIVKATILKSANEGVFNSWFDTVYYNPELVATVLVTVTVSSAVTELYGAVVVVGDKIAKTDSKGVAKFMMPAGTYDVLVSASGYVADTDTVTVATTAVTKAITLTGA